MLKTNRLKPFFLILITTALTTPGQSVGDQSYRSEYVAEQGRQIKSLSEQDIDALANGKGWGLAKAAELNGLPGPLHLLQMRDEISLTQEQVIAIESLYQDMKSEATGLGKQLIDLERQLNQAFADKAMSSEALRTYLHQIANTRMELRYVHLNAHLATPNILSTNQIAQYNTLRGYKDSDPCSRVPKGHDPDMWKRHNGCD